VLGDAGIAFGQLLTAMREEDQEIGDTAGGATWIAGGYLAWSMGRR